MTITETILAYLAYAEDDDDPDGDVPCLQCGKCECVCFDNGEDQEQVQ